MTVRYHVEYEVAVELFDPATSKGEYWEGKANDVLYFHPVPGTHFGPTQLLTLHQLYYIPQSSLETSLQFRAFLGTVECWSRRYVKPERQIKHFETTQHAMAAVQLIFPHLTWEWTNSETKAVKYGRTSLFGKSLKELGETINELEAAVKQLVKPPTGDAN